MKRILLITILALIIMVPALSRAQVCSQSNTINLSMVPLPQRLTKIQQTLNDYKLHPEGDHYEVCFQMDELPIANDNWPGALKMLIDTTEVKDVYVVGIKLKVDENKLIATNLMEAVNKGQGNLILKDFIFKNVNKGILLYGSRISLISSLIEGTALKKDACIDVQAKGAVIGNVTADSCKVGVLVQAGLVRINNSIIKQNKIGVDIMVGIEGTDIVSSKIYANDDGDSSNFKRDDGVRIEGGIAHAPTFYNVVNNEAVPVPDGEDVIEYKDRPAYILVPLPPGEESPGKVEFFLSNRDDCALPINIFSNNQPCGLVEKDGAPMRIDIDSAALEQGPVSVTIPPENYNKTLVTMYTDPKLGTAGISRAFSFTDKGVVTFVSTPYDIPTTGGATDVEIASGVDEGKEDVESEEGGSSVGGEAVVTGGGAIEGTGGSIASSGSSGGCGGGASLTRDSFLNIVFGVNLWWILLIAGLGIGAQMVRIRVKKRK